MWNAIMHLLQKLNTQGKRAPLFLSSLLSPQRAICCSSFKKNDFWDLLLLCWGDCHLSWFDGTFGTFCCALSCVRPHVCCARGARYVLCSPASFLHLCSGRALLLMQLNAASLGVSSLTLGTGWPGRNPALPILSQPWHGRWWASWLLGFRSPLSPSAPCALVLSPGLALALRESLSVLA